MIYSTLLKSLLSKLDILTYKKWNNQPLTVKPIATKEKYYDLWKKASSVNNPDVTEFEKKTGHKIERKWLDNLALKTQIVVKKSQINYAHGKILYSALCEYILKNPSKIKNVIILETGTARGFSSLCMAKALDDNNVPGSIITYDVLPHTKKIYWNCVTDHTDGPLSREELLEPWNDLISKYIIFHQGYSTIELKKIALQRINFAFLDGAHSYQDVFFEFNMIKNRQLNGDIIIFDDYNEKLFPGIVKAVDEICSKYDYEKKIIKSFDSRSYVIAKKSR
tara:strand:- start:41 stop:877 length:837 start_codon:yes stop_codon:yes gene_type:complete